LFLRQGLTFFAQGQASISILSGLWHSWMTGACHYAQLIGWDWVVGGRGRALTFCLGWPRTVVLPP
jgi:hypothetical protein